MISNLVLKRRISLGKDKVTRNGIQIKDFNIIEKEIENYRFSNRLILPEVWEFEQLSEIVTQYDFLLVSYEGLIKEFISCFEKEHPIVHNDMLISLGVFNIFRAIYHDLIVIRNCLSSRLEIQTNTVSRAFIEKSRILLLFSIDKEYAFDFISNVKKIDSYDRYSKYYKPSEVKKRILEIVKKEDKYKSLKYLLNENMNKKYSYLSEFAHLDIYSIMQYSFNKETGFNISEKLNESSLFYTMGENFAEYVLLVFSDFINLINGDIKRKEFNYYELGAYYLGFIEEIYK